MNKALEFLNEAQQLFQYAKHGNSSKTIGDTEKVLEAGIYDITMSMDGGAVYTKREIKSDNLLQLRNKHRQGILDEFKKFWTPEVKSKFEKLGLIHKRGFIYEGPPGTGKSCDMKLIMSEMVAAGDVVFIANSAGLLVEALKQFKEVEPNRHVAVIMEDFERMADYGEHELLELLDGPNAVGGVFYLATTNFINRVSERLKRKSRFDRIVHIGLPEYDDRFQYFKAKLNGVDTDENIAHLAKQTAGKSFADLKDIIVAIYCLGNSLEEVVLEMNNGSLRECGRSYDESELNQKLSEAFQLPGNLLESQGGAMDQRTRAQRFLELAGSLDRKALADHELASPRMATPKDQAAMAVAQKPSTPSGLMPNESPEGQPPVDQERVLKQINQRLDLLNIKGVSVEDVDCDDEGSIFVTFADEHGNEMEADFHYDDNDQACVYVKDYEMPLGGQMPGAVTTPSGKYINLYDPGFLDREAMMSIFTQGGLIPTKDRSAIPGKDAFGNRVSAPAGV